MRARVALQAEEGQEQSMERKVVRRPDASPWEPLPSSSPPRRDPRLRAMRAVVRGVGLGLLTTLFLALFAVAVTLSVYAHYASSLPSPQELPDRTTPFESTKIYDRNGELLYEVFDPLGGRRTVVPFADIPSVAIEATVAVEDGTFFSNPGLNPLSMARALYQDLRQGEIVQGGSTITQQLVKNLFLSRERTLSRKLREAILSAEVTRRYTKAEILEAYLNEVYFGNLAYGIGAAAETYFGKIASDLSLHEAGLLAGLIQSPAFHDPYSNPQAALARRATVLRLMHRRGYIDQAQLESALDEPLGTNPCGGPSRPCSPMEAPHMVMYVRERLETLYGTEMLYRGGLQVHTTLDLGLQHLAEKVARERIALLHGQDATNAALVAIDPNTGDILAMLGSVDFDDSEIDGQVNVVRRLRQPGSTLKPFTYLAAMERGWTAATVIMDVEQEFPDGLNPPYKPRNHDDKEYGPISLRRALACSRNIPAVSTLSQIGVPALLEVAHRFGIDSLDRPDYGLSLTLGGGEVTLLEMTAAYAALANGGRRVGPRAILRIHDQRGKVIMDQTPPQMPQVTDPRHAYLLTHILADDDARAPTFGLDTPLRLSFPAAVKTGTTDGYRDSWTIGYTPDLVTGVWVGNNDNAPMKQLTGARGAGLIWHDFMESALASAFHSDFSPPEGLIEVEVCPVSGQKRTSICPPGEKEIFLVENAPPDCTVHKRLRICQITGKLATEFCPAASVVERVYEDHGAEAIWRLWDNWVRKNKAVAEPIPSPPREFCPLHTRPAHVAIELPPGPLSGVIEVRGTTEVPGFAWYVIEYGLGADPGKWRRLTPQIVSPVSEGVLCSWDTRDLHDGTYVVRVVVADRRGDSYEAEATVEVLNPTPSATQTATQTLTQVATCSPQPSATPLPTMTRLPSSTPTMTPGATMTVRPTEPPLQSDTPRATMIPLPSSQPTPTETTTTVASPTSLQTATLEPPSPESPTSTMTMAPTSTPIASASTPIPVTQSPPETPSPARSAQAPAATPSQTEGLPTATPTPGSQAMSRPWRRSPRASSLHGVLQASGAQGDARGRRANMPDALLWHGLEAVGVSRGKELCI